MLPENAFAQKVAICKLFMKKSGQISEFLTFVLLSAPLGGVMRASSSDGICIRIIQGGGLWFD